MSGMQDTFKEGLSTPGETPTAAAVVTLGTDVSRSAEKLSMGRLDSPGASGSRRKRNRKDSWMYGSQTAHESKSWNEGAASELGKAMGSSFSSAGNKQPSLRFVDSTVFSRDHKVVIFELPSSEETYVLDFIFLSSLAMLCGVADFFLS